LEPIGSRDVIKTEVGGLLKRAVVLEHFFRVGRLSVSQYADEVSKKPTAYTMIWASPAIT
jgi:hypothetical protein